MIKYLKRKITKKSQENQFCITLDFAEKRDIQECVDVITNGFSFSFSMNDNLEDLREALEDLSWISADSIDICIINFDKTSLLENDQDAMRILFYFLEWLWNTKIQKKKVSMVFVFDSRKTIATEKKLYKEWYKLQG